MARIGETVERLKDLWLVGLMVGFVSVALLAVYGIFAMLIAVGISWLFGLSDNWTRELFLLSAFAWVPITLGYIGLPLRDRLPTLPLNEPDVIGQSRPAGR